MTTRVYINSASYSASERCFNALNNFCYLIKQVYAFQRHSIGIFGEERREIFILYFSDQSRDDHEIIFDMLEFDEPTKVLYRTAIDASKRPYEMLPTYKTVAEQIKELKAKQKAHLQTRKMLLAEWKRYKKLVRELSSHPIAMRAFYFTFEIDRWNLGIQNHEPTVEAFASAFNDVSPFDRITIYNLLEWNDKPETRNTGHWNNLKRDIDIAIQNSRIKG